MIIVVHEEALIGSSPGIIKFDVGQILGDPVGLSSGVLRVACMMLMLLFQNELGISLMLFDKNFSEVSLEG